MSTDTPDPIHGALKNVSYNRWTYALAAILAAAPLVLVGCGFLEGRVESDITGRSSTAGEIALAANARIADLDAQIAALASKRDALVEIAQAEVDEAEAITAERYAMIDAVMTELPSTPWGAAMAGSGVLGLVGVALGRHRDALRKDRIIRSVKNGGQ